MPRRIVIAANKNPFLTSLIFSAIIFSMGLTAFSIQSHRTIDRVAAEATERRVELAKALADSQKKADAVVAASLAATQKDVCERAVTAVTAQLNDDLLRVIKTVEDRFAEQGKPAPPVYSQLEFLITNRKPPLEACIPKENP